MFFWGTFKDLTTYLSLWIGFDTSATHYSVQKNIRVFKRKIYRSSYPIVPLVFIGISCVPGQYTSRRPKQAIAGIVVMIIGLPFYFLLRRINCRTSEVVLFFVTQSSSACFVLVPALSVRSNWIFWAHSLCQFFLLLHLSLQASLLSLSLFFRKRFIFPASPAYQYRP